MRINNIVIKKISTARSVIDCNIGRGYRQGESGSLPDV
jgi:hypothetical protein